MKKLSLVLMLLILFNTLQAQSEIEYITPPTIQNEKYSIDLEDIISKEDYCKFRLVVKNKTDQYMAFDIGKVGFVYANIGTYYPKKNNVVIIPPNDRILETIKIDGNMNYMVDNFEVLLEGLQFVIDEPTSMTTNYPLEEKSRQNLDNYTFEVKKAYQKRGKFSFVFQLIYEGSNKEFGTIDPQDFSLKGGDGTLHSPRLLSKKMKIVQDGKKLTVTGDLETEETEFSIDWGNGLKSYSLVPQTVSSVQIKRVGSVAVNPSPAPNPTPINSCPPAFGNTSGKCKINFYNAEHQCFKLYVNGALINNEFSSNVTFNSSQGKKMLELHFQNGHILKDNVLINFDWIELSYRIKPKDNSYKVNLNLASIVRETSTSNSSTTVIENHHHHGNGSNQNQSSVRSNCHPNNVTYGQFNDMKRQIEDEITDFNKITVAKNVVRNRCLTSNQVAELVRLFSMDDKRLEFAKHAYHYTYDIDNYYTVVNTLTFDMKKDELRKYINSN